MRLRHLFYWVHWPRLSAVPPQRGRCVGHGVLQLRRLPWTVRHGRVPRCQLTAHGLKQLHSQLLLQSFHGLLPIVLPLLLQIRSSLIDSSLETSWGHCHTIISEDHERFRHHLVRSGCRRLGTRFSHLVRPPDVTTYNSNQGSEPCSWNLTSFSRTWLGTMEKPKAETVCE